MESSFAKQDCCHKQPSHRFAKELSGKDTTKGWRPRSAAIHTQNLKATQICRHYLIPRSGLVQSILCWAQHNADYLFRWLALRFLEGDSGELSDTPLDISERPRKSDAVQALAEVVQLEDALVCPSCGSL